MILQWKNALFYLGIFRIGGYVMGRNHKEQPLLGKQFKRPFHTERSFAQ